MRTLRAVFTVFFVLLGVGLAHAGATLVKDLNTDPGWSFPSKMFQGGSSLFFYAYSPEPGYELWSTDGTSAGTALVKDIFPGVEHSQNDPYGEGGAVDMGTYTLFTAADGLNGYELWKSDGTEAGTALLADLTPGYFSTQFGCGTDRNSFFRFVKVGTAAYFPAMVQGGCRIVKSDGTKAGTLPVFTPGPNNFGGDSILTMTAVGTSKMFIATQPPAAPMRLWSYDIASNTVAQLNGGAVMTSEVFPVYNGENLDQIFQSGGYIYFLSMDFFTGANTLYKTNLLSPQTAVADLTNTWTSSLVESGSFFYFVTQTATGSALMRINPTTGGVVKITDLWTNPVDTTLSLNADRLFVVGSKIVVVANSWDSTTNFDGPVLLYGADVAGGPAARLATLNFSRDSELYYQMLANNGKLYFANSDPSNGTEMWYTDGTTLGTKLLLNINPGSDDGLDKNNFTIGKLGTDVYFSANDGVHGTELWKTGGTGASTVMLKDINTATNFSVGMFENINSSVEDLSAVLNGVTYYPCMEKLPGGGFEVCRTDGTAAGTYKLGNNFIGGNIGYEPKQLFATSDRLYFTTRSWNMMANADTKDLWASDGTDAGTVRVLQGENAMRTSTFSGYPNYFATMNGLLFFANYDSVNGAELWVSDGTAAGTHIVKDINPGSGWSSPTQLTVYNNNIYFSANDGVSGFELWRTDGTEAGTLLVKDIEPGTPGSSPGFFNFNVNARTMGVFNGYLYFTAQTTADGRELWKTDGTLAGTRQVWSFFAGSGGSNPRNLTPVGNTLFLRANGDNNLGHELFKCTTADLCSLVKEIYPGNSVFNTIQGLTAWNNLVFFWADDSVNGIEPWVSDGTAAGTHILADVKPGAGSSGPINPARPAMASLSDGVYFGANDGSHGYEIWKTDGVKTALYVDTYPGPVGGQIPGIREIVPGRTIQYAYAHPVYGAEVFTVEMGGDALVLNLPMDGSLADTSAAANTVTSAGVTPVADRFGGAAKAYSFDPTAPVGGSYIKVADSASLDTDDAFTLSAWVKVNSYGTAQSSLFSKWLSASSFGDYMLMLNTNGTLTFTVMSRSVSINTDNVRTTAKLPLGEWAHVAATFNAGEMKVFINGTLAASKVSTLVTATEPTEYTNDDLYVGSFYSGAFRLNGAMDEVRVYNRALSEAEVANFLDYLPTPTISLASGTYAGTQTVALSVVGEGFGIRYTLDGTTPTATTGTVYTVPLKLNGENQLRAVTTRAGFTLTSPVASANYTVNLGPVGGLALYLPLDGNLKDASGNNATVTSVNASPVVDRKGFANRAYAFNTAVTGAMNIKVLDSAALDTDSTFTLGAWIKVNALNATTPTALFAKWFSASVGCDYSLWINPNGTLAFNVANSDTGVVKIETLKSTGTIPLNQWTHVAATFNNGVMALYINAAPVGSFTSTAITHTETKEYLNDDVYLGSLYSGIYKLNGTMDEVRIYNRSLSNAEISIMSELLPAPVMTPPPGPYTAPVTVSLASSISGFSVRYTTDGTSPTTTNGTLYAGVPVAVNGPLNITAALFFGDSKMSSDFVGKYTTSFGPSDNLALYLAMDGNVNDTSGKNNVVQATNTAPATDVWGRTGMALSLDQTLTGGSRIKVLDNANLDTDTAFTLSAWVRLNAYGTSNSVIFAKWLSSASAGDYLIWVNTNGTISFNVASTESGSFKIDSLKTVAKIPLNTWTHVAFTFNAGAMGVHINGSTVSTKTSVLVTKTEPKEYGSDDLYIGSMYSKAYPFNGSIDEVRIYGRALAIQEIDGLRLGTTGLPLAGAAFAPTLAASAPAATAGSSFSAQTKSEPAPGEAWTDAASGITFGYVPAATFVMGSNTAPAACDASPAHLVSLSGGYWLGRSEVTQAQWEAVMGTQATCPECPVENVTFEEINTYLTKLSAKTGLAYSLPTEAQWEYAARSGGQATSWAGTNSEADVTNFGWLAPNSDFAAHPVGTRLPNGLGLNDMTGNVAEWVRDEYAPYTAAPAADPLTATSEPVKVYVVRGGSYLDDLTNASTFCREAAQAGAAHQAVGFRVVVGR